MTKISSVKLQVEHLHETLGIGTAQPRLSWTIETEIQNWYQSAYEIEEYDSAGTLLHQTGRVESDRSVLVAWPFAPLSSREQVSVRVRVWGRDGSASDWSESVLLEIGLLSTSDWTAQFITPTWDDDASRSNPAPLLRREFDVRPGVRMAQLYITALGVYEAQLNGAVIGDHVMAPGWTSYGHRLRYQTFDVTDLLQEGRNALGAMLGDGWFRGRLSFGGGRRNIYGDRLALLAQLEITYDDGTLERVVTDDAQAWRAVTGPILASDIYDGEIYDARLERDGWSEANYDDSDWTAVRPVDWDLATLVAPVGPPVRRIESIAPVSIITSPSGCTLLDFGQNLVGRLHLNVRGPRVIRSRCVMPKYSKTASWAHDRCVLPKQLTSTYCAARESKRGNRALPFMASAMLRWKTGLASWGSTTSTRSSVILIWSARVGSNVRIRS